MVRSALSLKDRILEKVSAKEHQLNPGFLVRVLARKGFHESEIRDSITLMIESGVLGVDKDLKLYSKSQAKPLKPARKPRTSLSKVRSEFKKLVIAEIKPGTRYVLVVNGIDPRQEDVNAISSAWKRKFPDVEAAIIMVDDVSTVDLYEVKP